MGVLVSSISQTKDSHVLLVQEAAERGSDRRAGKGGCDRLKQEITSAPHVTQSAAMAKKEKCLIKP